MFTFDMFTYNIWNTLYCIFCGLFIYRSKKSARSPLGNPLATEGALSTNHLPRNPHCSRQGRDLSWRGRPFFTTTEVTLLRGGWNLLITRIISVCVRLELVLQLLMNEKTLIKTCQTSVQHPWVKKQNKKKRYFAFVNDVSHFKQSR